MPDIAVRQAVPLRTIPGVELAATGTWKASTGTLTLTDRDFADAVAALDCPGVRNPVLKLGHDEQDSTGGVRWDGEPAVGWIANMRLSANGTKVIGDYTGVPAWLADVLPSAYPDRSIEIYQPFVCQIGHKHPAVITAVALLGVMPPGVGVIQSLQDVAALYTEDGQAGAQRADARAVVTAPTRVAVVLERRPHVPTRLATTVRLPIGDPMPATSGTARASVSVEDISRQYYESAGYSRWITQMHVDPLELIVADDADGKLYRVPVQMGKGETFTFGEEQEVAIEYKDVKTPAGSKAAASMPFRWPTKAAALAAAGVADPAAAPTLVTQNPDGMTTAVTTTNNTTPVYMPIGGPKVERTLPPAEAIRKVAAATVTDPQTPAAAPATGPTITEDKEASGMAVDAAKLREALGLAADASDDDVKAAAQAAFPASAPAAAPPESATPDPAALLAALPDNASVVVLDKTNYETLIDKANQGVQALAMARAGERDKVLEGACRDGRFPVSKLKSYKEMWDKNPDATRDFITLLPKNSIPTQLTAGLLGEEFDRSESDLAYEGVYGKEN